jgi:4'-phosphopantetheinyl transferase
VHVWRAALGRPERVRELLLRKLSEEERDRAKDILPAAARERWSTARALLRVILGRYLGLGPEDVALSADPDSKPVLRVGVGTSPPGFNVSHSGDVALFAVGGGPVGVDVERIRDDVDTERIAGRLFSPTEQSELEKLPETDRRRAFFAAWTRKEACAKAVGEGVAVFSGFTVPLADQQHGELVLDAGDGLPDGPWSLWDLAPKPGYAAAVAAQGGGLALRCFDLTPAEERQLRGPLPRLRGD